MTLTRWVMRIGLTMVVFLILVLAVVPRLFANSGSVLLVSSRSSASVAISSSEGLFLLDMDGNTRLRLGDFDFLFDIPVRSPNGEEYAILANRDVYLLDASSLAIRRLTNTPGQFELHLTWSTSGNQLAATLAGPLGEPRDVVLIDTNTGEIDNLTETPQRNEFIQSWSPDEHMLLYARIDDPINDLYLIDLADRSTRRIHEGYQGAWSPDGKHIAVVNVAGLLVVDPEGEIERIFPLTYVYTWSNTGHYLTVVNEEQILIADMQEGGLRKLVETQQTIGDISWSPDDSQMAFALGDDIYIAGAAGEPHNLTQSPERQESSPLWSPDGQQLAYLLWDAVCIYHFKTERENCRPLRPGRSFSVFWFDS